MSRHPQPPTRSSSAKPASSRPAPPRADTAPLAKAEPKASAPTTGSKGATKAAKKAPPPGAVTAIGLSKVYGDRPALAELDIHVGYGESVALIGHNGSGKTTFLRLAAGLLEPSDGSVLVDGHPAGSLPARAALAYLSDSPTFYEDLSVWEHLEYVARLHGHDDWEQDAADLLDHLGLYDRADDLPTSFSRGLRQKASIAMAFIRPFDVLVVDEPFVGLDASGKTALMELLAEAHGGGHTLLVATHELSFLETVERCVALRDGELLYDGTSRGIDVLSLVS
ncbi:MAG TPA: ABC transporter ATP-binding protein [Acidimicrobiales bacterium]